MQIYYSLTTTMFLLLLYYFMVSLAESVVTDINTDRAALLALRSGLNLEPYHILFHNWSDSSPICSWVGVTCDYRHQRVRLLNISSMGIKGNIVPHLGNLSFLVSLNVSYNNFRGSVPQELAKLRRLRILDLRFNNISGDFPSWIGSFPKLRFLNLRNNTFIGVIPPSLSNASSLEFFDVSYNLLRGGIPREMGDLRILRVLSLQDNQLTGSIPLTLFNLKKLKVLALNFNKLEGPIRREVGNLTQLEEVYLHTNKFIGEIPRDLLNISTLWMLSLSDNQLTGNLPSNFGHSLPNMEWLDFAGNHLTSESPDLSFITSLTNCRYLTVIGMSDNPLNGRLPSSIGNLSIFLESVFAYNCGLHGIISHEIGNLSNLITLSLFGNHLTGSIPIMLGNLQNLQLLRLYRNKIDGTIPTAVCKLVYLYWLELNDNQIGKSIPDCLGNLTSLRILQLGNNKFNSTIPASLWSLKDIQHLNLSSNFFVGSLLPQIGSFRAVTKIDFSTNLLSGIIPSAIGDINTLSTFLLNDNKFQGSIPDSIAQMVSLENLDLSYNNLSGQIPASLQTLEHLLRFNVSFNGLSGAIPSQGPFKNFSSQSFLSNKGLCGDSKYNVPPCRIIRVGRLNRKLKLRVSLISIAISIIVIVLILAYVLSRYRRKEGVSPASYYWSGPTPLRFSYYELLEATERYAENRLLGAGSFGSVYKGTLRDEKDVAVKVFNLDFEGAYKSFEVECKVLRELRHKNLCKVIGSCSNQDFKALVLEYMPNGSLEKWLYSHNYFLDLLQRINVMIDVAYALEYLHHGYSTTIIHCDLKPSNVLLDENMVAHLSDFGVSKLLDDGESVIQTITLATFGYIAPEFGTDGLVSTRCDVYSYGVMLMEVFTRVKPIDENFAETSSLRGWVKESMPKGISHILDSNLLRPDEEFLMEKLKCLSSILELAVRCSSESPSERIDIKDVCVALEKIKLQLLAYY